MTSRLPIEIVGEIIDYSSSPREVVPWLSVSRQAHARGANAPAYSEVVFWPPRSCLRTMPCVSGLQCMLKGASARRRMELTVVFKADVSCDYIEAVFAVVRAHGLAKAQRLVLQFLQCFDSVDHVPHLAPFLDWPAPRLKHLKIDAVGTSPHWSHPVDVELFHGVAPELRVVTISGIDVPMHRIPAFDRVKMLDVWSSTAFFSPGPGHSFLGGCSSLDHLSIRWLGKLQLTVEALAQPELQHRVAALRKLDIDLHFHGDRALQVLHLFGNQDMESIHAFGARLSTAFPRGFVSALIHTLPDPTHDLLELNLMRKFVNSSTVARHAFKFSVYGRLPRSFRAFVIDVSAAPWKAQIVSMARELHTCNVLANLKRITCRMSMLPSLAALSSPQFSFPSLTHLTMIIDQAPVAANEGSGRLCALSVTNVVFTAPAACFVLCKADNVPETAWAILRTWVLLRESLKLKIHQSPQQF